MFILIRKVLAEIEINYFGGVCDDKNCISLKSTNKTMNQNNRDNNTISKAISHVNLSNIDNNTMKI